jgi:phosphate starvation-inducible PhoH-like protein
MKNKGINIYTPKSPNQILYNNILSKDTEYLVSVVGPAGTGKTFLACIKAIEKLKEDKIEKIVITRPVISVEDENIGFLPGNIEKKMDPWVRPIYDVFLEFYSKKDMNDLILNNKIEISPLGFMRGRTFKNSLIIADEMQNSTPNQMLMLLTRLGINSKIVITGDLNQSDLKGKNGLEDLIYKLDNSKLPDNFHLIKFNETDVQRSILVTKILDLYNNKNMKKIIENEKENKYTKIELNNTNIDLKTAVNNTNTDSKTAVNNTNIDLKTAVNNTNTDSKTAVNNTNTDSKTVVNNTNTNSKTDVNNTNTNTKTAVNNTNIDLKTAVNNTNIDLKTDVNNTNIDLKTAVNNTNTNSKTAVNNTKVYLNNNNNTKRNLKYVKENDAALIPLKHVSRNYKHIIDY